MSLKLSGKIIFFLTLCSFFSSTYLANAESLMSTDGFDRYKFNSVDVWLNLQQKQSEAGSKIDVQANINNRNAYPIVEGSLFIKVYKKSTTYLDEGTNFFKKVPDKQIMNNGDDLVDQFMAVEGINLETNGNKAVNFSYSIPSSAEPGEYKLVTFFQSAEKFNLSGLSFSDDVLGNSASLKVTNNNFTGNVTLDRNKVELNSTPFNLIGFTKFFDAKNDIAVEVPVKNSTSDDQTATLTWELYYWDNLISANKISSQQEEIVLGAKEEKIVSYKIPASDQPVNYLLANLNWNGNHSIVAVRIGRSGVETVRNNFMGLTRFPLAAGTPVTVFATAHAVKQSDNFVEPIEYALGNKGLSDEGATTENLPKYSLTVFLKDKNDKLIKSFDYKGDIGGNITNYESSFTPEENINYVKLQTVLKNEKDDTIDSTEIVFDCDKINPAACLVKTGGEANNDKAVFSKNSLFKVVGLITLLLAVIILVGYKRTHYFSIFLSLITLFWGSMASVPTVSAQDLTFTLGESSLDGLSQQEKVLNGFLGDRAYKSGSGVVEGSYWWVTVKDATARVTYQGESSISEGTSSLHEGDVFYIEDKTKNDPNAIYWLTTGYSVDSPPGCWIEDGASIPPACYYSIYDVDWNINGATYNYKLNGAMTFSPPEINLVATGPVNCVPDGDLKWKCIVTGEGVIDLNLNYGSTSGKFLYEQKTNVDSYTGEFQSKLNCRTARYSNKTLPTKESDYKIAPPGCLVEQFGECSTVSYCNKNYGPFAWPCDEDDPSTLCQGTRKIKVGELEIEVPQDCHACDSNNNLILPPVVMHWNYLVGASESVTCGPADEQSYETLSSTSPNLCNSGDTVINFSGSGPWSWNCQNGVDVSSLCQADITSCNYTCGPNSCDAASCGSTLRRTCYKTNCGGGVAAQSNCNGGAGCPTDICSPCSSLPGHWKEIVP